MADEKRIKDFEAAVELLNDDWFAVDSPSQGTRKMQASMFQAGLQSQITDNRDDIDLHSGQIATLQLGVGNLGNDVDALETKVGDATLQTTAPDLSGAINEHETNISGLNSNLANMVTLKEFHSANVTLYTDTDYTDYHYIFTKTYSSTPRVILDVFTATSTRNNIPIAVIQALSLTSVIVRVWKQVGVQNTSSHTAMATPQINISVFGN